MLVTFLIFFQCYDFARVLFASTSAYTDKFNNNSNNNNRKTKPNKPNQDERDMLMKMDTDIDNDIDEVEMDIEMEMKMMETEMEEDFDSYADSFPAPLLTSTEKFALHRWINTVHLVLQVSRFLPRTMIMVSSYLSIHISNYLSTCPPLNVPTYMSMYLFVYLSNHV